MRRTFKLALLGGIVAGLGITGTVMAYAGWTVPNSRLAITANVAKMPPGVQPSVAKQSTSAVVSWSAQELVSGVRMDHYLVTARSADNPPRADVVHSVAASGGATESVTFAADEVAGGKWYWTIVPKFRRWVGAESGKSQRLTFPAAPGARSAGIPADPPAKVVAPAPPVASTTAPAGAATTSPPPAPTEVATTSPPAVAAEDDPVAPPVANDPAPPASSPVPPGPPANGPASGDILE